MPGETQTTVIESVLTSAPDRSAFTGSQRLFLQEIDKLKSEFRPLLTAQEIQDKKGDIQQKIVSKEITQEEAMPQLLALAGKAIEITTGKSLHDNQYICANILVGAMPEKLTALEKADKIKGIIAEMDSGEGKTLAIGAATIAAASITSMTKDTVDVLTTNDYLAMRDVSLLGEAYQLCGLTAGVITEDNRQYIFDNLYEEENTQYMHEVKGHGILSDSPARQRIYTSCDIIYGQPDTFIFDEENDNLEVFPGKMIQVHLPDGGPLERHRKVATIIDEIDDALIDKGTTPHRLSEVIEETSYTEEILDWVHQIALKLNPPIYDERHQLLEGDYSIDDTNKEDPSVHITEDGYKRLRDRFNLDDAMLFTHSLSAPVDGQYSPELTRVINTLANKFHTNNEKPIDETALAMHSTELHKYLQNAISVVAKSYMRQKDKKTGKETTKLSYSLWEKGRDYVVEEKNGEKNVVLVHKHVTQRKLPNTVIEGITQALEIKEGLHPRKPTIDAESMTTQSFLREYAWVCGTSGTAKSDEAIFQKIYNMDVQRVPPSNPSKLKFFPPEIYNEKDKSYGRVVDVTKDLQENGDDPILILAGSVQEAKDLAELLAKSFGRDVLSNTFLGQDQPNTDVVSLLTAENADHLEAQITANAGRLGSITVATFLAGRGTHIEADNLNIIAVNIPDRERQLTQAMHRTARQGKGGSFRIVANYETCELFREYGKDNVERQRRVFTLRRYLPGVGQLTRDENGNWTNNWRAITRAYKKTSQELGDQLEMSVHADAITNRDRAVYLSERDEVLRDPQSWITAKAPEELTELIHHDFLKIAQNHSWEHGNEEEFEEELDRTMVFRSYMMGQPITFRYLSAKELKDFLAEDAQKEGLESPQLTDFPFDVLEETAHIYLQQKLHTSSLQFFEPSGEKDSDEEVRDFVRGEIFRNFNLVANLTFPSIWSNHLSFLVENSNGISFHQKPFHKISLDAQKNLQGLLDDAKRQLMVLLLTNTISQQVLSASPQQQM